MENDGNKGKFESVYSTKVRAGKRRTYFFDVRKTKGEDFYVTITESTRKFEGEGYNRHKIFLYKEDFNRFVNSLTDAVNYVKKDLMPDYDYEQFERRQAEWEAQQAEEAANSAKEEASTSTEAEKESEEGGGEEGGGEEGGDEDSSESVESEEDMSW